MRQPSPVNTAIAVSNGIDRACQGHTVGVVVDEVKAILVKCRAEVGLSNGETDSVRETLAKRASRDLNTIRMSSLRVTRGQGVNLTELLEVVQGELVAEEVEEDVLERATAPDSAAARRPPSEKDLRVSGERL